MAFNLWFTWWCALGFGLVVLGARASDQVRFESIEAGENRYENVVVRSKNASSLIVTHSGGLAQIPLRDLPEDLQRQFGYDPKQYASREAGLERLRKKQIAEAKQLFEKRKREEAAARAARIRKGANQAVQHFGIAPELAKEMDLRPRFRSLGIHIGDQRKRPSCSIHAIVGALEYLEGRRHGAAGNLSENYLYWATLKTLGRFDQSELWNRPGGGNGDAGFQLREVIQALRAFGVPNASEVERFGFVDAESDIQAPTLDLAQAARHRSQFRAFVIPGRDPNILLGNIVHALNAGEPVVIGLAWPHFRSIRKTAYIENQAPQENYGHAVTLVGYRCPSGRLSDITFIFRNSWGPHWGADGYGFIRYKYIVRNIYGAYVMEAHGS